MRRARRLPAIFRRRSRCQRMTAASPAHPPSDLRAYQRAAIDAVLAARRAGRRRLLVHLPTGAGKTVIFSHLAKLARRQVLVLAHRDPSLTIPLCVSSDRDEIAAAWRMWCDILALPRLPEHKPREPAPRRRRHNAIRARRPKFLVRRRRGDLLNPANIHQGEREIIARD